VSRAGERKLDLIHKEKSEQNRLKKRGHLGWKKGPMRSALEKDKELGVVREKVENDT